LRADCLEPNAENATEAELLVAMEAAPNKRSYSVSSTGCSNRVKTPS
jgi:hypothetical protein